MVQTSSIALFATIALYAVSPALGAVLPNNAKAGSSVTTTTTAAAAATPTLKGDAARLQQEQKLIKELYDLEDGSTATKPLPAIKKPAQNLKKDDKKGTISSSSSSTPSGKPIDKKLADKLRLDKLRDEKLRLSEQRERLKLSQLDREIEHERLRIHDMDRERLQYQGKGRLSEDRLNKRPSGTPTSASATSTATPGSKPVDNIFVKKLGSTPSSSSSSAATKATGKSVNIVEQAQQQVQEKALIEDLERLVTRPGYRFSRDTEEGANWVRGYDNSENDVRDFDDSEGEFARGYDNSQNDARDFNPDAEYMTREHLEDFEHMVRDFDAFEDFSQRSEFEGLEDLD